MRPAFPSMKRQAGNPSAKTGWTLVLLLNEPYWEGRPSFLTPESEVLAALPARRWGAPISDRNESKLR